MALNAPTAFFFLVNLLFFSLVSSYCTTPSPPPPKKPRTPRTLCPPSPVVVPTNGKCPIDTLKIASCANVLNGLINAVLGVPPKEPCCTLVDGLADFEAAVCLCTVLRPNILGQTLNIPISLTLLVNFCGKSVPPDFQCP